MKMRMLKSAEEIELIRQGARITDVGEDAVVKAIKVGASEHEIALASTDAMVREIAATYPHSEIRDSKLFAICSRGLLHGVSNLMEYIIYDKNSQRSFSKSVNQPSRLDENTLYH